MMKLFLTRKKILKITTPSKIWKIRKIDTVPSAIEPRTWKKTTDKKMVKNVNGVVKQNRLLFSSYTSHSSKYWTLLLLFVRFSLHFLFSRGVHAPIFTIPTITRGLLDIHTSELVAKIMNYRIGALRRNSDGLRSKSILRDWAPGFGQSLYIWHMLLYEYVVPVVIICHRTTLRKHVKSKFTSNFVQAYLQSLYITPIHIIILFCSLYLNITLDIL